MFATSWHERALENRKKSKLGKVRLINYPLRPPINKHTADFTIVHCDHPRAEGSLEKKIDQLKMVYPLPLLQVSFRGGI